MGALDAAAWVTAMSVWGAAHALLGMVVMWMYPEPPRRRIERALFLVAAVWIVAVNGLQYVAGGWVAAAPPGVDFRTTAKWYWLSVYSPLGGFFAGVLAILWLRRALRHEGPERSGAVFWVQVASLPLAVALSHFLYITWNVWRLDNWLYHEWRPITGEVAGDPYHLTALLWLAGNGAIFGYVGYSAFKRQFVPLIVVACAIPLHFLREVATNTDPFAYISALHTLLFIVAVTKYNVFGVRTLPRWVGVSLAAGFGLSFFFLTVAIAVALGAEPLLFGGSIALGLLLGGLAVAFILRKVEGMRFSAASADPTTTRSRIEPYHAVLVQELASGTPAREAFEKLRPLRARLGISDHEHALLEYASGTAQVARLTDRAVKPGETFLSRYKVLSTLKEGGMGVTHLAIDERVGRRVVLKTLRSVRGTTSLDALLKEARALGRIEHPHVVRLIDADVVGDEAFLVMEYVDGGSLADRLERSPLTRAQFERVADDLLAAVEAVHGAGLVHRDIKPSNVLLTGAGRAKLADFGIAHLPGFETTAGAVPSEGAIGTIRYMSPEQARGRPPGPRSDLYSAAIVLYESWTGRAYHEPRANESAVELQLRVAGSGAFERDDVPAPLAAFFRRALHPIAGERFESAQAMRSALQAALGARQSVS